MLEAFLDFYRAAIRLSAEIEMRDAELEVCEEYPFDKSFDEVVFDIQKWTETQVARITNWRNSNVDV